MRNRFNGKKIIVLFSFIVTASISFYYWKFTRTGDPTENGNRPLTVPVATRVESPDKSIHQEPVVKVPEPPVIVPHTRANLSSDLVRVLDEFENLSSEFTGSALSHARMEFLSNLSAENTLTLEDSIILCGELFYSVSDHDLETAWAILLPNSIGRRDFNIQSTIEHYPKGALAAGFLKRMGNDLATMGRNLSEEDLSSLREAFPAADVEELIVANGQALGRTGSTKALDLLLQEEASLSDFGIARILRGLGSESQLKQFENRVVTDGSSGSSGDIVVRSYASGLAAVNPSGAASWVEQIADSKIRGLAGEVLIETWINSDPMSAGKWLASTNLEGMDPAISAFANGLARYSPTEARQWAEAITDEGRRTEVLRNIDSLHPPVQKR